MITKYFTDFITEIRNDHKKGIASFIYKLEKINFYCILQSLNDDKNDYFYLEKQKKDSKILAWSPLKSFIFTGINRIAQTEEAILKETGDYISNRSDFPGVSFPLFLGGIKFHPDNTVDPDKVWSDFNDSEWFIPSYMLFGNSEDFYLVYNFEVEKNDNDTLMKNFIATINLCEKYSKSETETTSIINTSLLNSEDDYKYWELNVNKALKKIEDDDAEKIVLSRRIKRELSNQPKISLLISKLAEQYPSCHTFAFRKGESIFFGASPERLASISNGWIEADALAGSSPRGNTEADDKELELELISSIKNLNEQKAVVDFIASSFNKFTDEINYPENPVIRKLPNIQHLWTPIRAKLSKGGSVFSLLKEIHPTPAICGVPWNKALSFINDSEPHNRGLYAGILGWFNFDNEGEFIVALRSGLLKDKTLYAFAGCGIVKGSNPKSEYDESELKLKPILSQFNNGKKG